MEKKLKSDDEFIQAKDKELKAKRVSLAKEAEKRRVSELNRQIDKVKLDLKKADEVYQKTVQADRTVKENIAKTKEELKREATEEKQVDPLTSSLLFFDT